MIMKNDDKEIQYGICRSRWATSFQYQDSSSLSPAQVIEQEVYYHYAKDELERGIYIAHLLVLLGIYNQLRATVVRWIGSNDSMTAAVHAQIICIKSMIKQLILLMTWTKAYGEFEHQHQHLTWRQFPPLSQPAAQFHFVVWSK